MKGPIQLPSQPLVNEIFRICLDLDFRPVSILDTYLLYQKKWPLNEFLFCSSKMATVKCSFQVKLRKGHPARTAQLCVLARRLARAWIQYATSARGLVADIAEKIAAKGLKKKIACCIRSVFISSQTWNQLKHQNYGVNPCKWYKLKQKQEQLKINIAIGLSSYQVANMCGLKSLNRSKIE